MIMLLGIAVLAISLFFYYRIENKKPSAMHDPDGYKSARQSQKFFAFLSLIGIIIILISLL